MQNFVALLDQGLCTKVSMSSTSADKVHHNVEHSQTTAFLFFFENTL